MKTRITKILSSRFVRGIRIYALVCVAASIVSVSATEVLLADAEAGTCSLNGATCSSPGDCPDGMCVQSPEMPIAMVPLFLLMSAGAVYYIRRRHLNFAI